MTVEATEPVFAGNEGGASVWVKWTAPSSGNFVFTTQGSSFDTIMGIFTGTALNALTEQASNDDESFPAISTSRIVLSATAGTTYYIAIDGYTDGGGAATGNVSLGWSPQ
jgi:hypothetical protein